MNTLTADTTTTHITEDRRHADRRATDATPTPIPFVPFIPASELARVADTVVTLGRELQAVAEIVEAATTPTEISVEDTEVTTEATAEDTSEATETPTRVKRTHRSKATNLHVFITNDRTKERTWARTDDKDTNFALTVKKLRRAIMTLAPQIGDTFTITPHPTVLVDIGTVLQPTTEENLISLTWEKSALQITTPAPATETTPVEVTQ